MIIIWIDNEKHIKDEFLDETLCQIPVSKWDETFELLLLDEVCKDCMDELNRRPDIEQHYEI